MISATATRCRRGLRGQEKGKAAEIVPAALRSLSSNDRYADYFFSAGFSGFFSLAFFSGLFLSAAFGQFGFLPSHSLPRLALTASARFRASAAALVAAARRVSAAFLRASAALRSCSGDGGWRLLASAAAFWISAAVF